MISPPPPAKAAMTTNYTNSLTSAKVTRINRISLLRFKFETKTYGEVPTATPRIKAKTDIKMKTTLNFGNIFRKINFLFRVSMINYDC